MYQYILDLKTGENRTDAIMRVSDKATIPFDPMNRDYVAFLAWLDEGNTPEAA